MAKPQNPLWQTSKTERKSYYSYFFGQNMIYHMIAGYLTTFLLLIGVNPVKSAIVMLIVKVWDAVNDAIFGVVFDKVKFKSNQKYIPWLKIACALTPASTIAIFVIPTASSETVKLIWFALAYIVWDTAYTICDVPAFGIITSMTSNIEERNTILSLKGITAGVGMALTAVLVTVLISEFVGLGYGPVSIIVAIVAMATMFPVCKHCKERNKSIDEEQFTVRKMLKYLFSNKYLLIYYGGYFFQSGFNVMIAMSLLTSYYLFHDERFSLLVLAVAGAPIFIASLFVPKLVEKYGKRKIFIISNWAAVIFGTISWFVGYQNVVLFIITTLLRAVPLGIQGIMIFMFTPDCAEYGRFKTGIDAKGITFAIQTFVTKMASALAGTLGMFLLGFFGWKEVNAESFKDLAAQNVQQSDFTLNGLWFIFVMVPTIGLILAGIFWQFYKLKDEDVKVMIDCNNGKITREEALEKISIRDEF
jgi:Na+/melibiose symporter-like transporter